MDQSQEILLGHAIFASSEYGYRRIARSISNKKFLSTCREAEYSHLAVKYDFNKRNLTVLNFTVAALHQGAQGQMTWLEDPPPWLKPCLRPA